MEKSETNLTIQHAIALFNAWLITVSVKPRMKLKVPFRRHSGIRWPVVNGSPAWFLFA